MAKLNELVKILQPRFGVLAESNTYQLTVIASDTDVAVGDLFLLPSNRGGVERFYVFRTTQYANIMNRTLEMNDVARNKLTMPDSYLADDLSDEKLIELKGIVLGYAQHDSATDDWSFFRPRRLPQHLTDVYHVTPGRTDIAHVVKTLMQSQLGTDGLYIGDLLAGECALEDVPVYLPTFALSHHIGIFGKTGCGKSNLIMVLLHSIMQHNQKVVLGKTQGPPVSILAIDPHDEFRTWHAASGGSDGIRGIVNSYSDDELKDLVEPFYYLTAKNIGRDGFAQRFFLSRADLTPDDLISIMDFSEQQISFSQQFYGRHGERWIGQLLLGDTDENVVEEETITEFLPGTVAAVQRRVGFLRHGQTRLFTRFDPEMGYDYDSTLPDVICAIEHGRVLVIDTTLMTEFEQFLLTTIIARVLFALRKALRSSENVGQLPSEIRQSLDNDDSNQQVGMRSLADELINRIESGQLPYITDGEITIQNNLPYINIVIEEAPSILNPARMKFGSVFRDISRQGRKFGIGLSVVSQQVSEIDQGVLTQLNTELIMSLGNENERKEAIKNASSDLMGFERELQVMGKGQVITSASFKDIPLPIQIKLF
ncbi:ATP-binding protein [Thermodesulfobacteriota bacterium]